jgi:hypothetical protein
VSETVAHAGCLLNRVAGVCSTLATRGGEKPRATNSSGGRWLHEFHYTQFSKGIILHEVHATFRWGSIRNNKSWNEIHKYLLVNHEKTLLSSGIWPFTVLLAFARLPHFTLKSNRALQAKCKQSVRRNNSAPRAIAMRLRNR